MRPLPSWCFPSRQGRGVTPPRSLVRLAGGGAGLYLLALPPTAQPTPGTWLHEAPRPALPASGGCGTVPQCRLGGQGQSTPRCSLLETWLQFGDCPSTRSLVRGLEVQRASLAPGTVTSVPANSWPPHSVTCLARSWSAVFTASPLTPLDSLHRE